MKIEITFKAREYQKPLIDYFRKGGRKACEIWHRKAGKDRTATFIESEMSFDRPGLYWHALPKYEDARKVIWDAIMPDGQRLLDWAFPESICKRNNHEMKVTLPNNSIWQPVGADNYDALVGAFPVHITWSEFALMSPNARNYLRPALALNNGSELVITTTRGYNHAFDLYQYAKGSKDWHTSMLTVDDTNILSKEVLEEERQTMPDELFRQEYYCDWSAANVGSILGRYVEMAEKDNRIIDFDYDWSPVVVSCDIGFRDTAAFWYWVPRHGGFDLIDYDEARGLDAEEWIPRIKNKKYPIKTIYLPQDAKIKTFQSRHSTMEQFLEAFGKKVEIVPAAKKQDQINAARMVIQRCRFHATNCKQGLMGLREWAFKYDEEKKNYSKDPDHNWASHPSDGFAYGSQVLQELIIEDKKEEPVRQIAVYHNTATLNDLWDSVPQASGRI